MTKPVHALAKVLLTFVCNTFAIAGYAEKDSLTVDDAPVAGLLTAPGGPAVADSVLIAAQTEAVLASAVVAPAVSGSAGDGLSVADDGLMAGRAMIPDSLMMPVDPAFARKVRLNLYDLPYSTTFSSPDWSRLWLHTGVLFAGGVATLGVLQLLPENATAWNKKRITSIPFWKRWSYHVSRGPVWDGDNFIFNYILHPYAGAVYYMGARSVGFNRLGSFLYCAAISTVFWEYGIEAFMEKPSIQDLILTPLSGFFLGEVFYKLKRKIVNDGYRLWGSRTWGDIVAFLIDPVNEVIGLFAGNPCREALKRKSRVAVSCTPWIVPHYGGSYGFTVSLSM